MNRCRVCGDKLKLHNGAVTYGAKVHTCSTCGAPYVDPKIVELAAVSESDRAGHRLRYASGKNVKKSLAAALLITLAAAVLLSAPIVRELEALLLIFFGSFAGLSLVCFLVKFFFVFPRMARQSKQRMTDAWYLTKLKACYSRAA